MLLTYYHNETDKRYVDKKLTQISLQDHANPVTVKLLDNTSITNPTFKMKDLDLYMTANYCYVDDLRRYYFIDDITVSNGYAYLQCTCDVLSTYKNALRNQTCIIKRQEHIPYNDLFQNDPKIAVKQYPAKRCIGEFNATPFSTKTNQYVLGVVGSSTGGNTP